MKKISALCLAVLLIVMCVPIGLSASANTDAPAFSASSVPAEPGDTVSVDISVSGNPGIIAASLTITYDETALTLIDAEDKGLLKDPCFTADLTQQPYILSWNEDTDTNNTANGVVATLTFQVAAFAAAGDYTVGLAIAKGGFVYDSESGEFVYDENAGGNVFDKDLNDIDFAAESGTITVAAAEVLDPLKFSTASLTLYNNIAINFKAAETLFTSGQYTNPYAVFELNGVQTTVTDYTVSGGYYVFDFDAIKPSQINDSISYTLYAYHNGVLCQSETKQYGIATYCYNQLGKATSSDEFKTLLVDLLNYGDKSQIYENYKTDSLASANLTEEQRAYGTSDDPVLTSVKNANYATISDPSVTWAGVGLNLTDSVLIRVKFNASDITDLSVKVNGVNGEITILASKFEAAENGGYYAFFEGLNAGQFSEAFDFTVYKNDTAVSNTLRYSVESYAYDHQNDGTALEDIVKAIMKYGNSAKIFNDN